MAQTFSVKNFDRFQHYKDRSPPWIKLYNELLDDYDFGALSDGAKWHLVAIWLLASRSENKLPLDARWIARRINAASDVDLKELIDAGFLVINQEVRNAEHHASKPLDLARSRETEGEAEKEGEAENARYAENVIDLVVRDVEVSPQDPFADDPCHPRHYWSEAELDLLRVEFDGVPVDDVLPDLVHWATGSQRLCKPNEVKRACYGALRKQHGRLGAARELLTGKDSSEPVAVGAHLIETLKRRTA